MADDSTEGKGTGGLSRRELLKRAGVGAGGLAVTGSLAGPAWARPNGTTASRGRKVGTGARPRAASRRSQASQSAIGSTRKQWL